MGILKLLLTKTYYLVPYLVPVMNIALWFHIWYHLNGDSDVSFSESPSKNEGLTK